MGRRSTVLICTALLAVLWAATGFSLLVMNGQRMNQERFVARINDRIDAATALDASGQTDFVRDLANAYHHLTLSERLAPATRAAIESQLARLDPTAQRTFFEEALPSGAREMIARLDELTPEERRSFLIQNFPDYGQTTNTADDPQDAAAEDSEADTENSPSNHDSEPTASHGMFGLGALTDMTNMPQAGRMLVMKKIEQDGFGWILETTQPAILLRALPTLHSFQSDLRTMRHDLHANASPVQGPRG